MRLVETIVSRCREIEMVLIAYSVYLALSCLMLSCYYDIVLYSVYSCHDPFSCLHAENHWAYQALCMTRFLSSSFLLYLVDLILCICSFLSLMVGSERLSCIPEVAGNN